MPDPCLRESVRFPPAYVEQMRSQGIWNGDTVPRWLFRYAHATPNKAAIVGPAETLSYGEAFRRATNLARAFIALGLRKGDVVAIQIPNVPEFAIAYFAATMIGAVLAPIHMPYRTAEIAPLLKHARARLAICGPALADYVPAESFLALRNTVHSLAHVVVVGASHRGALSLQQLIEAGPFGDIASPPKANDPAVLCFTSGTSGAPKAVVHSSYTMLANSRLCGPLYGLSAQDILLSAAPFSHAYGLCILNFALSVGATQLLLPAFRPDLLVQVIAAQNPTMLFTVPAHLAATLKSGLLDRADFSSLSLVTIAGSVCPPQLARTMQERLPHGKVMQLWGSTESFMGLSTGLDDTERVRCESVGRPAPGMEARIIDQSGEPVRAGEPGELQIRGPSLFAGYYDNARANEAAFHDGWFLTGDLASFDVGGNIRITGRLNELINRGGVKINPVDVEATIEKHPNVLQCAIVPMPDEVLGEKGCAFVVPRAGESVKLGEICEWLRENDVAKVRWPERLELIDTMPVTPTRKIIKGLLRARLG